MRMLLLQWQVQVDWCRDFYPQPSIDLFQVVGYSCRSHTPSVLHRNSEGIMFPQVLMYMSKHLVIWNSPCCKSFPIQLYSIKFISTSRNRRLH
ncbi:hypothetical protein CDAR_439091 [Caerostris darwini]|uniref:Uncharacterized protein n=1 Tax=Caerostris darwini TaxID=1538125 RepID=A0AAV4MIS9_9ARAC|nr:hypothetical protein CDAR_439091 [Caerostris darwini]